MDQQKVFPTAMFGFQKKVVLDYIYSKDAAAKAREAELQGETDAMGAKTEELRGVVEELTSQQEILKAQLYNEKEAHAAQKAAYDKLKADADQLVQVARNKDNELQIQLELNKQLQNKSADQEGKIKLLLARLEQMEAQQEQNPARQAMEKAAKEADAVLETARRQAKEMVESAAASVRAAKAAGELGRLKDEFSGLKADIWATLGAFEQTLSGLGGDAAEVQAEVKEAEEAEEAGETGQPAERPDPYTQDHFFR